MGLEARMEKQSGLAKVQLAPCLEKRLRWKESPARRFHRELLGLGLWLLVIIRRRNIG